MSGKIDPSKGTPCVLPLSTSFTPEAIPSAAVDADLAPFTTLINEFYCVEFRLQKLMTCFPLLHMVQSHVSNTLELASRRDAAFCERIIGKKDAILGDLIEEFFSSLYEFKNTKNPKEVGEFLKKCIIALENTTLFQNYQIISVLNSMIDCFKTGRVDLFSHPIYQFIYPDYKYSEEERYRIAVKSCQDLYRAMNRWGVFSVDRLIPGLMSASDLNPSFGEIYNSSLVFLQKNSILTRAQKIDVLAVLRSLNDEYCEQVQVFGQSQAVALGRDIVQNYLPVIQCEAVDKITLTRNLGENIEEDLLFFDREYVLNNKEIYENFLPRVQEMYDATMQAAEALHGISAHLKDFYLYLRFGDLTKLKRLLEEKPLFFSEFKKIFLKELTLFSEQLRDPACPFFFDVIKCLGTEKSIKEFRNLQLKDESFFKNSALFLNVLLKDALVFAHEHQGDLFLEPPKVKKAKAPEKNTPALMKEVPSLKSAQTSFEEPLKEKQPTTSFVKEEEVLIKRMRESHEKMDLCIQNLSKNCAGYQSVEALSNAKTHFHCLLFACSRLTEQMASGLTREKIHAFVIDSVRHTTLAVEQMLTALDRVSNGMKKDEQVITHNLYNLLLHCQLKAGPLPSALRQWVAQSTIGEMWVRNLSACQMNISPLQTLLALTLRFIGGNDAFTPQEIIAKTLAYCQGGIDVCQALSRQIDAAKKKPSPSQAQNNDEMHKAFSSLFVALVENSAKASLLDKAAPSPLSSLRNTLETFGAMHPSLSIRSRIENVLNHLLVHLETEIESKDHLNPQNAFIHLSNVLLLDQMIAEETLLFVSSALQIEQTKSEAADHDLLKMAKALGMKEQAFSSEEREFLRRGKHTRMLARYPASYDALHPIKEQGRGVEKAVHMALDLSSQQPGANTASLWKQIKSVVSTDTALLSSILKKVVEFSASFSEKP